MAKSRASKVALKDATRKAFVKNAEITIAMESVGHLRRHMERKLFYWNYECNICGNELVTSVYKPRQTGVFDKIGAYLDEDRLEIIAQHYLNNHSNEVTIEVLKA